MIIVKRTLSLMVGLIFSGVFMTTLSPADGTSSTHSKRLVTVRDAITATKLGLPDSVLSGDISDLAAIFSPDRQRFLVVLKRGDLENNTNDFSVFLYETASALKAPAPRTLFTMSSSSNHEAIRDIKWQDDSRTFHFLGENHGGPTALYRFTIADNHLERVTQHATPVVAYDVSMDGGTILFEADPPLAKGCSHLSTPSNGTVISTESLLEILQPGCREEFQPSTTEGEELFLIRNRAGEKRIPMQDVLYELDDCVSLSPDGGHGLVEVAVRDVPTEWSEYQQAWLQEAIQSRRKRGEARAAIERRMLLNTDSLEVRPLLNTPLDVRHHRLFWLPDGKSVVLSGAYLPLTGVSDAEERRSRSARSYVVQITIPEGYLQKITAGDVWIKGWDGKSRKLTLARFGLGLTQEIMTYQKQSDEWTELSAWSEQAIPEDRIRVVLKEDANTPPRIVVDDPRTGHDAVLFDLNPWLADVALGKVEVITWKAKDGHEVMGGLFYPPDYTPGRRYPLVIQTHGFLDHKFYLDGPWSSGFAAQPLASRGILVLQVGYPTSVSENRYVNTPQEAPEAMATYEGAIDYLNRRALIDTERVGILGFSRTVFTVGYTLTHSKYQFVAATLVDGFTGGYMGFLSFPGDWNTPALNGGLPFGRGLQSWLERAPEFNIDKVTTPIRLEAYSAASVVGLWEWFMGLSDQGRPVDFIYLPNGTHLLSKPTERLVSQQGNVDWFCFWLKGEEDPDPAKAEQYERWRELRKLQERNEKRPVDVPAPTSH